MAGYAPQVPAPAVPTPTVPTPAQPVPMPVAAAAVPTYQVPTPAPVSVPAAQVPAPVVPQPAAAAPPVATAAVPAAVPAAAPQAAAPRKTVEDVAKRFMPRAISVTNGTEEETTEDYISRLRRELMKQHVELTDLKAARGDEPKNFAGSYCDGSCVYAVHQQGRKVTILGSRRAADLPGAGNVVGDKLCAWGMSATLSNGTITWSNGTVWTIPKEVKVGPTRYCVTLAKSAEPGCQDVGLDIEVPPGEPNDARVLNIKEGLIQKHNATNPVYPVKVGDYIIGINGKTGSADVLKNELQFATQLQIILCPGELRKELVSKSAAAQDGNVRQCRCGHIPAPHDVFCTKCGTQVPIARKPGDTAGVPGVFDVVGRWRHGPDHNVYRISRIGDRLVFQEGDGDAGNRGELFATISDGEPWLMAKISGLVDGSIRVRPHGKNMISQFLKDGETAWGKFREAQQEITFDVEFAGISFDDDARRTLHFTERPLGFEIDPREGTIKHLMPQFGATSMGAQEGWRLEKIAGRPTANMDCGTVLRLLDAGSEGLPEKVVDGMTISQIFEEVERTRMIHRIQEEQAEGKKGIFESIGNFFGVVD